MKLKTIFFLFLLLGLAISRNSNLRNNLEFIAEEEEDDEHKRFSKTWNKKWGQTWSIHNEQKLSRPLLAQEMEKIEQQIRQDLDIRMKHMDEEIEKSFEKKFTEPIVGNWDVPTNLIVPILPKTYALPLQIHESDQEISDSETVIDSDIQEYISENDNEQQDQQNDQEDQDFITITLQIFPEETESSDIQFTDTYEEDTGSDTYQTDTSSDINNPSNNKFLQKLIKFIQNQISKRLPNFRFSKEEQQLQVQAEVNPEIKIQDQKITEQKAEQPKTEEPEIEEPKQETETPQIEDIVRQIIKERLPKNIDEQKMEQIYKKVMSQI